MAGLLFCCLDFAGQAQKAQAKPSFRTHHQNVSEPAGMRALAFAPKRRVVENGNGRLPEGTLVWVVAVGRSLVGASAHSYHLLVTWTLS